jgi:hypothetical protein
LALQALENEACHAEGQMKLTVLYVIVVGALVWWLTAKAKRQV